MTSRDSVEEEFHEFVASRSGALLRTAYLLAGDWATAEDLLQTALTKTYLAWKRLGQIEAVEPYARRVLVNTATSWWRRRWHGERPTETLPERAGPDLIQEHLERDVLWRHVKALPARQRAVLVLRFYEDLSEAQTAALLDISPGTVKSQTSRALGTLRKRLVAEGLTPAAMSGAPVRVQLPTAHETPVPAVGGGTPTATPSPYAQPPAGGESAAPATTGPVRSGQPLPAARLPGGCILPLPAYASSGAVER
ncbi:SigE family RNA polymerase sigma factor [Micromonospora sp. NBC_01813]|uniref:SigE family RNA polymerase sigma factor n=1 Tax=Micromonospora sp. NBC_01813 TaxID=2975988 RepID=UPI002DDC59C4|nr:SigE family RNA polymerase sigma factor [Micromonospora sp. NBC_01813]WSA06417.1 SigE family RNA polymerase sigma factor [Micromonospora sp. NBC_01813]